MDHHRHNCHLFGRRTSRLVAIWAVVAVTFAVLLVLEAVSHGPYDDPDPARQRNGILIASKYALHAPTLPRAVLPVNHELAVIVFVPATHTQSTCRTLQKRRGITNHADIVVVEPLQLASCNRQVMVARRSGRALAQAFGLRRPRSGRLPVGYALIDAASRVRYATLDPALASPNTDLQITTQEMRTMLGALS